MNTYFLSPMKVRPERTIRVRNIYSFSRRRLKRLKKFGFKINRDYQYHQKHIRIIELPDGVYLLQHDSDRNLYQIAAVKKNVAINQYLDYADVLGVVLLPFDMNGGILNLGEF